VRPSIGYVGHEPLSVPYREADLSRVTTIPVAGRQNKVESKLLASPPGPNRSFTAFLDSLPDVLAACGGRPRDAHHAKSHCSPPSRPA
jgi:hypothetical protein